MISSDLDCSSIDVVVADVSFVFAYLSVRILRRQALVRIGRFLSPLLRGAQADLTRHGNLLQRKWQSNWLKRIRHLPDPIAPGRDASVERMFEAVSASDFPL